MSHCPRACGFSYAVTASRWSRRDLDSWGNCLWSGRSMTAFGQKQPLDLG